MRPGWDLNPGVLVKTTDLKSDALDLTRPGFSILNKLIVS